MRSITRGVGPFRLLGLVAVALVLGVTAGMGALPGRYATAQTVGTVQPVGTVTVQKVLVLPNGTAVPTAQAGDLSGFTFVLTGGGQMFTLTTNQAGVATLGIPPGNYAISEQARVGTTPLGFTIDGAPVAGFQVVAGETVSVVATNQVAGTASITVFKQIVDQNGNVLTNADPSGFAFQVTGPGGPTATQTTGSSGTITFANLAAGLYSVTEQPRQGFSFVGMLIGGVPAANGQQFMLQAGQSQQIIVQNRQGGGTGTVQAIKQVVDANNNVVATADRSGFQLTVTCPGGFTQTATTDVNGVANFTNVPAGNCTVAEAARAGWTLVGIFVGTTTTDIGNNGTFAVTAGMQTALTVRNRAQQAATEPVPLFAGCNNQTITWPVGTPMATVAASITPPGALDAIWRFDAALGRFRGFNPSAPAFVNDYVMQETSLEAVWICMRQPGTLNRPRV